MAKSKRFFLASDIEAVIELTRGFISSALDGIDKGKYQEGMAEIAMMHVNHCREVIHYAEKILENDRTISLEERDPFMIAMKKVLTFEVEVNKVDPSLWPKITVQ